MATCRRWIALGFVLTTLNGVVAQEREKSRGPDGCAMAELMKRAQASVVTVRAFLSEDGREWIRVGSGFVYDGDGFVVTRRSVVQESDSIVVTFTDGRRTPAWVVYSDDMTEVALLKLPLHGLLPLSLGESSGLAVRSRLAVLGNSVGIFPSMTLGLYLGRRMDGMLGLGVVVPPGNGGSPVLDEEGRVVGILAGRILEEEERDGERVMGVALPVEMFRDVLNEVLNQYEEKGWIGISVVNSEGLEMGVRVVGVVPGGPAERAGICEGDIIVGFEGGPIHDLGELISRVQDTPPGRRVLFSVRKGERVVSRFVRVDMMPLSKKRKMIKGP